MKTHLAWLLMTVSLGAVAQTTGSVAFSGQVVESHLTTPLAKVVPATAPASDGSMSTTYIVQSVPTGAKLATFTTQVQADAFAAQVTPAVAYRN